ncbi:MAG: alpha-E domain-containing protein [Trueperaceae bacterium]|nr:alpha-E domain-containing protein [Trueperaceae bacterium]
MLSRIAESLYWFGRYVERAEHTARLLDVNYHAIVEAPLTTGRSIVAEQWAPLLASTGSEDGFRMHFDRADSNSVPHWLTLHPDNPVSIRASLSFARENARALRDRISTEMWEAVNRAYLDLAQSPNLWDEADLHDYCVAVREASHLLLGIAHATLLRDDGWSFLRAGHYLERGGSTVRLLQVRQRGARSDEPVSAGLALHRAMSLLRSASAYEAFRKRHHGSPDLASISAFLLLDPTFPRSLLYCCEHLDEVLHEIGLRHPAESSREAQRLSGWLAAQLRYCGDVAEILDGGGAFPGLDELGTRLAGLSDEIGRSYFLQ